MLCLPERPQVRPLAPPIGRELRTTAIGSCEQPYLRTLSSVASPNLVQKPDLLAAALQPPMYKEYMTISKRSIGIIPPSTEIHLTLSVDFGSGPKDEGPYLAIR
ncbi:hypothetical protein UY3_08827 [Chelonia mydas]|uniref:Uncharacterized protein n=1 Tax=Chelonia mydas TaxID=8469 RepID=M7BA31_CHEMY|nr:hypothetical protein UY3_08827 [Chelonia mydas]